MQLQLASCMHVTFVSIAPLYDCQDWACVMTVYMHGSIWNLAKKAKVMSAWPWVLLLIIAMHGNRQALV